MLVLTRKLHGVVLIDNDTIAVSVDEIRGSVVRLAVLAPEGVPVMRDDSPCPGYKGKAGRLCLSRKVNERIFIGADRSIVVTVVRISASSVRLGIEAPLHVGIRREELEPREQAAA